LATLFLTNMSYATVGKLKRVNAYDPRPIKIFSHSPNGLGKYRNPRATEWESMYNMHKCAKFGNIHSWIFIPSNLKKKYYW
jgi:hypothetical protein